MIVTAVTVTAGRTRLLQQALACFEAQDYPDKRMVILNTFPRQELVYDNPLVDVVNCDERPKSLGEARNKAVDFAEDGVIVVWDDDDLFLPHHLRVYAEAFAAREADWIRAIPVWYAEQYEIRKPFSTWINSIAFDKIAWKKIGGYPQQTVGEDQVFFRKLSEACSGRSLELKPEEISAIYCWGQGVYHVSGLGMDKADQVPAWERYQKDLDARIAAGKEPVGTVKLIPRLEHDPKAMVAKYLNVQTSLKRPQTKKDSVCFIELGRYGDIINILPLLYHCAETYDIPHLMVSREFADVLDGCSYVEPEIVPFRNDQIIDAIETANRKFKHVINCQVWGHKWNQERKCPAFNMESWRNAGFQYLFHDFSLYPVFDKRDRAKEAQYAAKLYQTDKKKILVNIRSMSSPFKRGPELLARIQKTFGEAFEVVDVTALRVDHLYDLLGAMEQASCIVSMDTSLVHLAAGTSTPLVCIVPPAWTGSIPRCHVSRVFTYTEIEAILDLHPNESALDVAIRDYASAPPPLFLLPHSKPLSPPDRTIYHVVERHEEKNPHEVKRKRRAQASWDTLYRNSNVIPCHLWEPYKRNAKQELGDPRALPYLKDVFAAGMEQAGENDIIMFSNDDNWLHPLLPDIVRFHCSLWGACSSQRCEFRDGPILPPNKPPAAFAMAGRLHMGRDIFAFTKKWLAVHWDEIPDFVLGASDWDLCMAMLVRLQWGIVSTRKNVEHIIWPAELKRGYVSHEYHPPKWLDPNNVNVAPSQKWNRGLFQKWASPRLPALKFNEHGAI